MPAVVTVAVEVPLFALPNVTVPEPLNFLHVPGPDKGILPAKVAELVTHTVVTGPAVAVVGAASKVTEQVAVLAAHVPFVAFHVATYGPAVDAVTVEVPLPALPKVNPEPLHAPTPTDGVLPANVAGPVIHTFETAPAVAVVGNAV